MKVTYPVLDPAGRERIKEEVRQIVAARALVQDLFTPNVPLYWADFLGHAAVGWGAVWMMTLPALAGWKRTVLYGVAVAALYRAVIFIHEIAHHRPGAKTGFRAVWNAVCGVPLLVPAFTYGGVHLDHHHERVYGTPGDGEYLPFAKMSPLVLLGHLLVGFAVPLAAILRFVFLTPLAWVLPPLRRWTWERASSLVVDLSYRRGPPKPDDRHWRWEEFFTWLWGAGMLTLLWTGRVPWALGAAWYATAVGIFLVNGVRTLVAHRYLHGQADILTLMEQFHDSVDVPGHPLLTEFWGPVGLRWHATHHLFPGMPYHNLGRAHRRLATRLPDNEWFIRSTSPTLRSALWDLWRRATSPSSLTVRR